MLKEKDKVGRLDFKTYCKATVIITMWYWKRQMDEWNRIESPKIDPQKYIQ
jgi:hypothetical protein